MMRAIGLVGIAALTIVSTSPQLSAQAMSFREAKCAQVPDISIKPLPPIESRSGIEDGAMCPWRVDYPARVHLTTYPQYPEEMAAIAMPGDVLLQFIFDRSGQVDTSHVVELHATNSQFAHAVRVAMSQWSGETALLGAQAMPQWLTIDVRFHSEGCRGLSNPAVIATTALLCVAPPGKK